MRKIMIIGSGGAGKSTFSRRLGEILQLPVFHLDALYWKKDWVLASREEQIQVQKELVTQEAWIIDGNYGFTMDIRLEAADTIIFIDLPRIQCLYRVIKRRIQYHNKTRPDMGEGCEEQLDFEFLKWVWTYPKVKRPAILGKIQAVSAEKNIVIFKSSAEIEEFLQKL
ncbi:AAA family ATPase [Bacillus pseudomycoides]|uniref:DNA topology modulation protein n=1 Tax=Bacillus cereus group TaxID=86661 RepID=UPI0001A14F1D|nr:MULTISPECIES: DNA topology modulation protein [Bacillus cereus group]EEM09860.1 Topology modulation protein [Bacillus pseudomycoides]MBD5795893.1 AAA family ATPase [Bacillus pseudomycoides]MBJ8029752.1 DNA topology modulation protein [Bacillus cereus group sp. N21]MED1474073.1 DNA topology modulation protein [Bacillus pseudomycoides]PDZ10089.1 AAA family ATPase [Bacillus pseudomycoides]